MNKSPIKCLVLHVFPDLEALFMSYLVRTKDEVRAELGVIATPEVRLIPAGPLRESDWPGVSPLTTDELDRRGYLSLDCGGSRFDQHDRGAEHLRNLASSLDLLASHVGLASSAPHLMPIVGIISGNDLTGSDIVKDRGMKKSPTPHTARHLRNMICGWNLNHSDQPEQVSRLADVAFAAIEMGAGQVPSGSAIDAYRDLFLAENICLAVERYLAPHADEFGDPELAKAIRGFRDAATLAIARMEAEWSDGERDYGRSRQHKLVHQRMMEGQVVGREILVNEGLSDSIRYGAVTRFRDNDVTIQFHKDGRFVISTRGIALHDVAQAVREADLKRRGVILSDDDRESLKRVGHLSFQDRLGHPAQALYLAECGKQFGNGFRGNPFAALSVLERSEIVRLVLTALRKRPV